MGFSIKNLKTDQKKETGGVWIDAAGGLRLLLARFPNDKYSAAVKQLGEPHLYRIRSGDTSIVEDISKEAIAKHVLLGWENLDDEDGKPIKYSPEKALELLRTVRDFYLMVVEIASQRQLFKEEDKKAALGN